MKSLFNMDLSALEQRIMHIDPPKKLYGKTADLIWIDDLEVAAPQPPKRKPMPYYHHRCRF